MTRGKHGFKGGMESRSEQKGRRSDGMGRLRGRRDNKNEEHCREYSPNRKKDFGSASISDYKIDSRREQRERCYKNELVKESVGNQENKRVSKGPIVAEEVIKLREKVIIPVDDYPGFNFVGRLLGPKGTVLKGLQASTMTKISIFGKGLTQDKTKVETLLKQNQMKFSYFFESLNEPLHVLIQVQAPMIVAHKRMAAALREVNKYMIPDNIEDSLTMYKSMVLGGGDDESGERKKLTTPRDKNERKVINESIIPGDKDEKIEYDGYAVSEDSFKRGEQENRTNLDDLMFLNKQSFIDHSKEQSFMHGTLSNKQSCVTRERYLGGALKERSSAQVDSSREQYLGDTLKERSSVQRDSFRERYLGGALKERSPAQVDSSREQYLGGTLKERSSVQRDSFRERYLGGTLKERSSVQEGSFREQYLGAAVKERSSVQEGSSKEQPYLHGVSMSDQPSSMYGQSSSGVTSIAPRHDNYTYNQCGDSQNSYYERCSETSPSHYYDSKRESSPSHYQDNRREGSPSHYYDSRNTNQHVANPYSYSPKRFKEFAVGDNFYPTT